MIQPSALAPSADSPAADSKKRLFIGLIAGSSLIVCLVLVLLWIVPYVGLANIHPVAPWAFGGVMAGSIGLVCWSALGLILHIRLGRPVLFSGRFRGLTIRLFLPLMTLLARSLGIDKERVRSSFIKVNNELVLSERKKYDPGQILLLMPHCLQSSRCQYRLTYDIRNCRRCGQCPIDGLITLSDAYGIHLAVATGGTIARRVVVQKRPKLILATACERDLASGIQDTYPLPVYGVLNERPNGPCLDTFINLRHVEDALLMFLKHPVRRNIPDARAQADAASLPQPAPGQSTRPDAPAVSPVATDPADRETEAPRAVPSAS